MPKKSNKTAHVLNLITGPGDEQTTPPEKSASQAAAQPTEAPQAIQNEKQQTPPPDAAAPAAPQTAAVAPPPRPTIPILQSAQQNEQILSEKIRDDLTTALESALMAEAPAPAVKAPEPVVQTPAPAVKAPEPVAAASAPIEVAPAPTEKAPEPVVQTPTPVEVAPAPVEAAPASAAKAPEPVAAAPALGRPLPGVAAVERRALSGVDDITYTNITQSLVDENAMYIIKQFSACRCNHCIADVKALALNNLPPKYVVMQRDALVPMFSVFESRMQAQVTAELTRSCLRVNQSPRH